MAISDQASSSQVKAGGSQSGSTDATMIELRWLLESISVAQEAMKAAIVDNQDVLAGAVIEILDLLKKTPTAAIPEWLQNARTAIASDKIKEFIPKEDKKYDRDQAANPFILDAYKKSQDAIKAFEEDLEAAEALVTDALKRGFADLGVHEKLILIFDTLLDISKQLHDLKASSSSMVESIAAGLIANGMTKAVGKMVTSEALQGLVMAGIEASGGAVVSSAAGGTSAVAGGTAATVGLSAAAVAAAAILGVVAMRFALKDTEFGKSLEEVGRSYIQFNLDALSSPSPPPPQASVTNYNTCKVSVDARGLPPDEAAALGERAGFNELTNMTDNTTRSTI